MQVCVCVHVSICVFVYVCVYVLVQVKEKKNCRFFKRTLDFCFIKVEAMGETQRIVLFNCVSTSKSFLTFLQLKVYTNTVVSTLPGKFMIKMTSLY